MIDRATVDRIMDAAQIVDVVSDFVTLRKAGVNYKGLCPFHDDRTPSFVVSPSKGLCKCFACGKGGNAVHFIMEHEQLSYPDALRYLARKYNIEIKERELTEEEKQAQDERESMFVVNEWACQFFQDQLYNTVDGRAIGMTYFRSRGFRDDIIKKFQLGYSPSQRDACAREAKAKGYKEEFLLSTGLCYKRDNGQLQDRFFGRRGVERESSGFRRTCIRRSHQRSQCQIPKLSGIRHLFQEKRVVWIVFGQTSYRQT